jgi:hypothetical protein
MSMFIRQMSDAELILAAAGAIKIGASETARAIAREQRRRLLAELSPPTRDDIRRTVAETKKELGK